MWTRVTVGRSGAEVFRGDGVYRKLTPGAETEAATLTWLRDHGIPAAEVLDVGPDWLLTREVAGHTGAYRWPRDQRRRVIDAIAELTQTLHAVPVAGCPFDHTLARTVPEASAAAGAGQIDLDDLDSRWHGYDVPDLLDAVAEQLPEMAAREVPVVTHGDWCLPNVVLDPATVSVAGVLDTPRLGRADRHVDLALMSRSLLPRFGANGAERFLHRCGDDPPDGAALAFYRLLDEFF